MGRRYNPNLDVDPTAKLTLCGSGRQQYLLSFVDSSAAATWFAETIIKGWGTDNEQLNQFINELAGIIQFLPVEVDGDGVVKLRNLAAS
jgi:hypothetical protein